jgi:hypothetical protein
MKTIDAPDFYGHTIFCDDIRREEGGKITFIGTYAAHLYVHGSFPLILPKFGVWIQYNQRRESLIKPVRFYIFLPGDKDDQPSIIIEVPEEGTIEAVEKSGYLKRELSLDDKINPTYVGSGASSVFSPFIILQPGLIKVRAVRGEKLVRLGGLAVLPAPAIPPA